MLSNTNLVEQWEVFELVLNGPSESDCHPFIDVELSARFQHKNRVLELDGFYDGSGVYRIRFMPDTSGLWRYETHSNRPELHGITGELTCVAPQAHNHGPVGVRDVYHLGYADGTPYFEVGTTCYAWIHQGMALEEQTLQTLKESPFNKLRMCVFPKDYAFNKNEPALYPFKRNNDGTWDFTRFDPGFFQHLEQRMNDLLALGIQADVILFHPYDRWGFAKMDAVSDDRYVRYVVARLAAFRNVWWSLANEWDLMSKSVADWDRFFKIIQECDPYQHLRSIHNCNLLFDHSKPWITHASIQNWNFNLNLEQIRTWRDQYRKPVVIDECCYEGNISQRWGNLTAQEMVRRFWEATLHGGYAGHGETFLHPQDILWWSKGGVLYGQSPQRIAFYRQILEEHLADGLNPVETVNRDGFLCAGKPGEYYLTYTGVHSPAQLSFTLPAGRYRIDVIDTWEMTITSLPDLYQGSFMIELPGKPYIAVQLSRQF